MAETYVGLEISRALDTILAREYSATYPEGLGGWLQERRGPLWPSFCWVQVLPDRWELWPFFTEIGAKNDFDGGPQRAYIHAITWLEAMDFCEQLLGWRWSRDVRGRLYIEQAQTHRSIDGLATFEECSWVIIRRTR